MWFRTPGGTPGAAWQALCPPSPSGSQSLGPPSGSAVPSASHRRTDEGKRCARGPPGPAAAGQRRKTEKTTFHNAASANFTHAKKKKKKKNNSWEFISYCSFFSLISYCFSWSLEELLEVSSCANSRFDCMSDDSSRERIQNLPLADQLTNKLWTQRRCQIWDRKSVV